MTRFENDMTFVKVHGDHCARRFLPLLAAGKFAVICKEPVPDPDQPFRYVVRTVFQTEDLFVQQLSGCTFGDHGGTLYQVDGDWLIFDVTRWTLQTSYASLKLKQRT